MPAAIAAPAVCATGVGCVFLGVVVLGGVAYAVWQSQSGQKLYNPIEDPEEEIERMGNNAQDGRIIIANSPSHAHSRCSKFANGRKVAMPQNLGEGR